MSWRKRACGLGIGRVGKTQAAEYAYRFAGTDDLAWWINSEQAGLFGDQFAALGTALGCIEAGANTEAVRLAVLGELPERGRWLLVFDNVENPADITEWLPGGSGGHVLITTREQGWTEIAAPVEVDVLARSESVAGLQGLVTGLSEADADRLAAALGDLPLAIAQAAGFMAETGMPATEYLALLKTRASQIPDQGAPGPLRGRWPPPPSSLPTGWPVMTRPLSSWRACARSLPPSRSPEDLLTSAPAELPGELEARAADPLGLAPDPGPPDPASAGSNR